MHDIRYKSARQVWHDCYTLAEKTPGGTYILGDPSCKRINFFTQKAARTITAQATEPKRSSRAIDIPESFELVKAHSIIKEMEPLHRAWGMYAYTYQFTEKQHQQLLDGLFAWWYEQQGRLFRGEFTKTLQHMALVSKALEEMKHRYNTAQGFTHVEYCHVMKVHKQNWQRDWADRLKLIQQKIDKLDKECLAPIAEMLNNRPMRDEEITT